MDLRDLVLGHPRETDREGVYRIAWGEGVDEGFELDHGTLVQLAGCLEIEMAQVAYWTKYAANLDHAALLGLCTKLYLALMDQRSRMQSMQSKRARNVRSRSPTLRQREVIPGAPPPPLPTLGRKDGHPTPPMSARTDSSRDGRRMPDVFQRLSRPPSVDPQVIRGIEADSVAQKASDKLKQVLDGHHAHDESSQQPHQVGDRPTDRRSSGEVFNRLYNAGKEQKVRRRVNEEIVSIEAQARFDAQREEAQRHPRGTPRDGLTTSLRLFDDAKQRADESARLQHQLDEAARLDSNAITQELSTKSGARDRSTSSKRVSLERPTGRVHERLYKNHNEHRRRLEELSNKHIANTCPFRPNLNQSGKVQRSSSASNLNTSVSRSSSAPRAVPTVPVVAPPADARDKGLEEILQSSTPTTQQVIETLGSARRAAHDLLDSLGAIEVPIAEEVVRKEQVGMIGAFAPPPRSGLRY
jgi:hypothetical protein